MKKPAAIVLAATVLLATTGCTPQLSTSETCVELRAITSRLDDVSEDERKQIIDDLDKLAGRASDTLKEVLRDLTFINREGFKSGKDQDTTKLDEAQERVQAKEDMVRSTCNL